MGCPFRNPSLFALNFDWLPQFYFLKQLKTYFLKQKFVYIPFCNFCTSRAKISGGDRVRTKWPHGYGRDQRHHFFF